MRTDTLLSSCSDNEGEQIPGSKEVAQLQLEVDIDFEYDFLEKCKVSPTKCKEYRYLK